MLIIGSVALAKQGFLQEGRVPKDVDLIMTEDEASSIRNHYSSILPSENIINTPSGFAVKSDNFILDIEVAYKDSSGYRLLEYCGALTKEVVATPDIVYTLKMSHRYLKDSPSFKKTMFDIKHLRSEGFKIPNDLKDWFIQREKETYTYNHPKLAVSKENFFKDDNIPYEYDHDSLHLAVALRDYPAYMDFKPSNQEVLCSRELFEECPSRVKLNAVVEEAMVLSLERSLIPNKFTPDPDKIFEYALMKISTSITSGWFREYCWEHYDEALDLYKSLGRGFMENSFNNGLSIGLVKQFEGVKY